MCGFICAITTTAIGAALVVVTSLVGYVFVPDIVANILQNEVILIEDTIQFERFEEVPFPLNFTVRVWNIDNPDEVLAGGVPVLSERGPYIYKLYQYRVISDINEDNVTYRRLDRFEFDAEGSYPNTQDDMVTIANIPYHAILQVAEQMFPTLMGVLSLALNGIFNQYNGPIMTVSVRSLLFDGLSLCASPGLVGAVACAQVRDLSQDAMNLAEQEDGSLLFSLLAHKNNTLIGEYVVSRGLQDANDLGIMSLFDGSPYLSYWTNSSPEEVSVCNMLNGTDSGIFNPFVDREKSLYAINTDICRCVELRHEYDLEYEGIPVGRFVLNEWFLDNDEGCFCLNVTRAPGLNRDDGCLLKGAMELYTCVGAFLVLTYPHFLFADPIYQNGVLGMNPVRDDHRIFLDIETNTGTVIRGAKRGQFNIMMRPITSIAATQNLIPTLTPLVWFEEGMSLPEEYVDEIKDRLLAPLDLLDILIPVLIALSCAVLLVGVLLAVRVKLRTNNSALALSTSPQ